MPSLKQGIRLCTFCCDSTSNALFQTGHSLYHIRAIEANAQFETRHSRLSHNKMCRADAKAVADVNRFLNQAFRREVLAETAVRKVYSRQFLSPRWVMLRRTRVNSLIDSPI